MKIAVIGAGHVGSTAALMMAQRDLGDIVLVDVVPGMPVAKGLDISQAGPMLGYCCGVRGTNDYRDILDAEVVVIAAGITRRPGMRRMDLLETNARIVASAVENIVHYAPHSIIIMVTTPPDVLSYVAMKLSGFGSQRVLGMAGVLDSARFRYFIAERVGVAVEDVQAMVIGGHGDAMVPLARYATVSGIPLTQLLDENGIEEIVNRVRQAGSEIVNLLHDGNAYYGPAAAVTRMVEAITRDKRQVRPCSVYLHGEYGLQDVFIGVPVILSKNGVERVIEIKLSALEKASLERSAAEVREGIEAWQALMQPDLEHIEAGD